MFCDSDEKCDPLVSSVSLGVCQKPVFWEEIYVFLFEHLLEDFLSMERKMGWD
jgi:hypothetical protein